MSPRIPLLLFLLVLAIPIGIAHADALSDETTPLFLAQPVKHNFMILLDSSESMADELALTGTESGKLTGSVLVSNGGNSSVMALIPSRHQVTPAACDYLDPTANPEALNCESRLLFAGEEEGVTYVLIIADPTHGIGGASAVPPLPQYAFTRSVEYNESYFDINASYPPWIGEDGSPLYPITSCQLGSSDVAEHSSCAVKSDGSGDANANRAEASLTNPVVDRFYDLEETIYPAGSAALSHSYLVGPEGLVIPPGTVLRFEDVASGGDPPDWASLIAGGYVEEVSLPATPNGFLNADGDPVDPNDPIDSWEINDPLQKWYRVLSDQHLVVGAQPSEDSMTTDAALIPTGWYYISTQLNVYYSTVGSPASYTIEVPGEAVSAPVEFQDLDCGDQDGLNDAVRAIIGDVAVSGCGSGNDACFLKEVAVDRGVEEAPTFKEGPSDSHLSLCPGKADYYMVSDTKGYDCNDEPVMLDLSSEDGENWSCHLISGAKDDGLKPNLWDGSPRPPLPSRKSNNTSQPFFSLTYTPLAKSTETLSGDCATPLPQHYRMFERLPDGLVSATVDALAPDGRCLVRNQITDASELQQFANWFTYHRRRSHALRTALGYSLSGVSDLRVGIMTTHDAEAAKSRLYTPFYDMSDPTAREEVFGFYSRLSEENLSGGTPNREGLLAAGNLFHSQPGDGDSGGDFVLGTVDCCEEGALGCTNACPISEPCQKNFVMLFTDGYSSGFEIYDFDGAGGDVDGTAPAPYTDSTGTTDSLSDLAYHFYETDVIALDQNKVQVASGCVEGLDDPTPPADKPWLDCNDDPHVVTYAITLNVTGESVFGHSPYIIGTGEDAGDLVERVYANNPTWLAPLPGGWEPGDPQDFVEGIEADDLFHATINGRGEMINATNPTDLQLAFDSVLDSIQEEIGSAAAVTFNSQTLDTTSAIYLALFDSKDWSGELFALEIDSETGDLVRVGGQIKELWEASEEFPGSRTLLTYGFEDLAPPADDQWKGFSFTWSDLDALDGNAEADLTALGGSTGAELVDFIRFDSNGEPLRERGSPLGDIIGSSPTFVGAPALKWPDSDPFGTVTNRYSHYKSEYSERPGVIYVGANDGMLHGFDAESGEELVGYIPHALYSSEASAGLHYLADDDYNHQYYVDGTPSVSDVYLDSKNRWATVLVGGLGAGGRGLYALDVSGDESGGTVTMNFDADNVLWEFTSEDDPDLGHTFAHPSIVMLNDRRWAVVVGNGYHVSGESDTGTGEAALFIIFLDSDASDGWDGAVWEEGSWTGSPSSAEYLKILTGVGGPAANDVNGLSSASPIDMNNDDIVDLVYAGDRQGNLWVFDLCDTGKKITTSGQEDKFDSCYGISSDLWGVRYISGTTPLPLFQAVGVSHASSENETHPKLRGSPSNEIALPITSAPEVIAHPTKGLPRTLVMFGTGSYLEPNDIDYWGDNYVYGIGDLGAPLELNPSQEYTFGTSGSDRLVDQELDEITDFATGRDVRVIVSEQSIDWEGNDRGWRIWLPLGHTDNGSTSAERVASSPVIRGDTLFFNTTIPVSEACDFGGTGYLMSVNAANGGAPSRPVFDLNGDDAVDSEDKARESSGDAYTVPVGEEFDLGLPTPSAFLGDFQYTSGTKTQSGEDIAKRLLVPLGLSIGRLAWEELIP